MGTNCKHADNFFCTTVTVPEGSTYAMACSHRCGFWLNFDPIYAGSIREQHTPKNPWHDYWNITTMAFHPYPDPTREWKTPQPMAVEGARMRKGEF